MHKTTITVPIYQFKCIITIDNDIEKRINSCIKKNKLSIDLLKDGEEVHGLALNPALARIYYLFYSIESFTANIITHEVSHLVDYILEDRNINDAEARAYLNGYINEKIFDYAIKNQLLINKWLSAEKNQKSLKKVQIEEDSSLHKDNS